MASPDQAAIEDPKARYLGAGAIAAAQTTPSGSLPQGLAVSFVVDSISISLYVTPRNAENLVFLLYVAGRWPWVNAFLEAVFRRIVPDTGRPLTTLELERRTSQRSQEYELQLSLIPALVTADRNLKNSIASVLAEVAETALDIAFENANSTRVWLDAERARYGIDNSRSSFPCEKFLNENPDSPSGGVPDTESSSDTGSGTTTDGGNSDLSGGTEGGTATGNDSAQDDAALRAQAILVRGLIKDLKQLFVLYCALQDAAKPHDALTRAREPSSPSWDTPAPPPDQGAIDREEAIRQERMAGPAKRFSEALRDRAAIAPIVSGALGELVNIVGSSQSGKIAGSEKEIRDRIYLACGNYVTHASQALALVPRSYNSAALKAQMAGRRSREDRADLHGLGVILEDTPETRAALWTLRSDKPQALDPLEADTLLQAVRNEITQSARGKDEAVQLQAAFAASVIESYRYAWSESQVIVRARQHRDDAPLKRYDTTAAVLSLAGLVVGSVAALPAGAIGLYSLYHHAINQFSAFDLQASRSQKQLLQDVLTNDLLRQVDTIVTAPNGTNQVLSAIAPMVFDQIVMHLPGIGAWYAASMDLSTILENN